MASHTVSIRGALGVTHSPRKLFDSHRLSDLLSHNQLEAFSTECRSDILANKTALDLYLSSCQQLTIYNSNSHIKENLIKINLVSSFVRKG